MRNRAAIIGLLSVGLSLVVAAPGARAETQTFTFDNTNGKGIPLTQTDWGPPGGGIYHSPNSTVLAGIDPFVVPLFDPSKNLVNGKPGQLIRVDVSVGYQFQNTLTLTFFNPGQVTMNASGTISLEDPHGNALLPGALAPSFAATGTATASPNDMFTHTVALPTTTKAGAAGTGYIDAGTLNEFTGSGTISLPAYASAQSSVSVVGGNGGGISTTYASATLSITYTFVPEPSSLVLTGLGLIGLVAAGRVRSRRTPGLAA